MPEPLLKIVVVAVLAIEGTFWLGVAYVILRAGDPAPWFGR